MARVLRGLLALGAVSLAIGSLLSIAVAAPPLGLVEHFRLHITVLAFGLACLAAAIRYWRGLDALLVVALLNGIIVAPSLMGPCAQATAGLATGPRLTVLLLNVHASNTNHAATQRLLEQADADLVALVEVNQRWLDALAPALARYPHRITGPRDDNFGVALFAKPSMTGRVVSPQGRTPTIEATFGDLDLGVVLLHPFPPLTRELAARQVHELDAAALAAQAQPNAIVLGDFNATPWSRALHRFASTSGLCDTRRGIGNHATFPATAGWLGIPIDHVFVTCSIKVHRRIVGPNVGSDHLPVLIDLQLPGRSPTF